jgi:thiol-disulfide isomerase/thioredoxin
MWYRHKVWAGSLLVFACLAGGHAEMLVGDKFPPLDASALAGGTPPATAGKVTLVDFWASWCDPCKVSFPTYAQLHADYRSRGLVIVAVSVDENQTKFEAFVKQQAPPFATLRDKAHQLVSQVKVPTMPTCYLLGRDGRVRFVHQSFHGAETDREIRREIDLLLTETPPST